MYHPPRNTANQTSHAGRPMVVDFGSLDRDWIVCGSRTTAWARGTQKLRGKLHNSLIWIRILLYLYLASSNVCTADAGMGRCVVVALTWFRRSLIRLLGLPRLLTLYLELYSFVLHRLARRIRLQTFACALQNDMSSSSRCSAGAPKKVGRAQHTLGKPQNSCIGEKSNQHASSTASSTSASSSYTSHARPLSSFRLNPPMPHSRSKTTSQADLVGQGKRLSLQFPIQPATGTSSPGTNSPRSRPSSWVAPSKVLSPETENPPTEANFLAVLAAQERYVLELKDDLVKAEADLKTLKKHYALHEANKRRNDVRKVAQLQPVNTLIDITPENENEDEDGSSTLMQKEMERRKALLANTKSSQRKVFSGSRHLRTLSLLSPDKTHAPSFPQPLDLHEDEPVVSKQPEPAPRSSTSSDHTKQLIDINNERYDMAGLPTIQKEQLIRAGTQMANDFKNGFFTFIDDIRQATVGDEAVNGHDEESGLGASDSLLKGLRKPSSTRPALNRSASSKKSSQRQGSIGDDFWKENGLSEPKTSTVPNKKTHTNKPAQTPQKQTQKVVDEEEEWDNWETPNDTYSQKTVDAQDSSDESEASSPGPGSSRTSTRYHSKRHDSKASSLTTVSSTDDAVRDSKRNSIPWPDLVKMSPSNLKRTASHLMKEWEKQLTPPPESRNSNHSHGDYIGRSDSPSLI
jgi:hypothetical protein